MTPQPPQSSRLSLATHSSMAERSSPPADSSPRSRSRRRAAFFEKGAFLSAILRAVSTERERATTFDELAELYDRYRPGYPDQLFDDLFEIAGITANRTRILEVGCGTGKATAALASRDAEILALDPGAHLLEVARRNLRGNPRVSFVHSRFEDFRVPPGDERELLVSAQAFHWIDPDRRFELARRALRDGGSIALLWNVPSRGDSHTDRAIHKAYGRFAPELLDVWWAKPETRAKVEDSIDESCLFGTVRMCRYPWKRYIPAADYGPLLETQSDHRLLPEARRLALFEEVMRAIERTGGVLESHGVARLFVAKTR